MRIPCNAVEAQRISAALESENAARIKGATFLENDSTKVEFFRVDGRIVRKVSGGSRCATRYEILTGETEDMFRKHYKMK